MKIIPDSSQIAALASQYDVIPISREIYADIITPITLLRKIAEKSERYFLLESIEGGENGGVIPLSVLTPCYVSHAKIMLLP